jgi:hypothetical protein
MRKTTVLGSKYLCSAFKGEAVVVTIWRFWSYFTEETLSFMGLMQLIMFATNIVCCGYKFKIKYSLWADNLRLLTLIHIYYPHMVTITHFRVIKITGHNMY